MGNIGNLVGRDQKHQVGSIILAKILKMAPQRFLAYVREVKELPLFGLIMRKEGEGEMTALADINLSSIQQRIMTGRVQSRFPPSRFVRPVLLPNARYLRNKSRLLSPSVLAEIRLIRNNGPMVYYRNRALATCYEVDETGLVNLVEQSTDKQVGQLLSLLHHLRRIDTRIRMTHTVLQGLIARQTRYLETGTATLLAQVSRQDFLKRKIDASRLSRILGNSTILMPSGTEAPLSHLLPKVRELVTIHLQAILREESEAFNRGILERPASDPELANQLALRCALRISRVTVGKARADLGVPSARYRYRKGRVTYLGAEYPFGSYERLESRTVRHLAPAGSGLYELSLESNGIDYPLGSSPVFYIGSSKSLRKRLLEHIAPNSKNPVVAKKLASGPCRFRVIPLAKNHRHAESELFNRFVAFYGSYPVGNRAKP